MRFDTGAVALPRRNSVSALPNSRFPGSSPDGSASGATASGNAESAPAASPASPVRLIRSRTAVLIHGTSMFTGQAGTQRVQPVQRSVNSAATSSPSTPASQPVAMPPE